jgi:NTP pyrophosphatase (non-canonical NTP hydrolase)
MTLNEYQLQALTFSLIKEDVQLIYGALGLNGESGEVAEKVKKIIRDQGGVLTEENKADIRKELGDALWYISLCAHAIGCSLDEIAKNNIEKLSSRKQRGVLSGSGDNR